MVLTRSRSIGLFILLSAGMFCLDYYTGISFGFSKFFELCINAFSILVGFLLTVSTLVNSIKNEKMEFIRNSGGMQKLNRYLKLTIFVGLFSILVCMLYLFLDGNTSDSQLITYPLFSLNVIALLLCVDFTHLFISIVLKD